MALGPGTRVGPYEILAPIGAGGMGEVYRARDSRLNRDVAVKVLSASFADNPERLRRFELEARATGMLNHPNILAVYDVGTHKGSPYLVTELLEGKTLREEMPVPRRKALDYARQIATGLAAAHAKGVTHRDLKPENLFVTTDGRVKILDFGLAKVETPETDVTRTAGTTPGVAMGTVGYMSPEQALGKAADHRSDIFSFGAILYEMSGGTRAFHAASGIETLNAILKADPPPLPDAALERLVRRCLEKSPEQRFQSAADLAFDLDALSGTSASAVSIAPVKKRMAILRTGALVIVVLAVGIAAGLWWQARQDAAAAPGWTGVRLGGPDLTFNARISPNGQSLAFVTTVDGQEQVAVMNPNSGDWNVVTHERTKGYAWLLAWSPDGTRIYFDRRSGQSSSIFTVPALGGEEQLVLEDALAPEVLPDGSLIVVRRNAERQHQLHRFWPQTGQVQPLAADAGSALSSARSTPDGKEIVFYGRPMPSAKPDSQYYALDLASNKARPLAPAMRNPVGSLAIAPGGQSVLLMKLTGDLVKVVEVPLNREADFAWMAPLHGAGPERPVLDWNAYINASMDAGPDGSLYFGDSDRPVDVLRFPVSGGIPERLVGASSAAAEAFNVLQVPDGRVVFPSRLLGRRRLLAAKPGQDPHAFVQTDEDTDIPIALLGASTLALRTGKVGDPASWMLAIVSLADGRMIRRLDSTKGLDLGSLAASTDGKTLYYAAGGSIWAISTNGGQPSKVTAGNGVSVDPNGRDLIVTHVEMDGAHLFRVPLSGASEQAIPFSTIGLQLYGDENSPNSVAKDGRILVEVDSIDSCWERPAILDPRTGKVERITAPYPGDIWNPVWAPDGRIVAEGVLVRSALWRYRKEKKP